MPEEIKITDNAYDMQTSYKKWLKQEGLPVIEGFYIEDLKTVEVHPWSRMDAKGTYINLEGTGGTNDSYVCEIPPGGHTAPEKHMFEDFIYVVEGRGATTIWIDEKRKQTFEWGPGSLFSPPLNVWHQFFNGQGDKPARLLGVTTAPTVIDLYHNLDFIFNCDYVFRDRYDEESDYFASQGKLLPGRVWESNFIPDAPNFKLNSWKERGAGGTNVMFEMSSNTMCAHISEFPLGTYKKGHRHGPGAHVILLAGKGYSLLWQEGEKDFRKVDWHAGSMFVPPNQWFHQHFNVGLDPARYMAIRWGGQRFPTATGGNVKLADRSLKQGGYQIEYEDEDPRVLDIFEQEVTKEGGTPLMAQYFPWRKKG